MTSAIRRAGGFAAVGTLALAAPALGRASALPFVGVAVLAAFVVDEGPLFELFARPGDHRDGRLNGLAGFALAAAGLGILATIPAFGVPLSVYVSAVVILAYGNLGATILDGSNPFRSAAGFVATGTAAGFAGRLVLADSLAAVSPSRVVFLAASGAFAAALLRSVLYRRDDPVVMLSVGLFLWLFEVITPAVAASRLGVALAVTAVLGYASYALGTASVAGMLTGVLLGLLTIVFGGYGWFAVLITFFAVGGLAAKYRYDDKRDRGVAEDNEGARGSGNVLGNSAVALAAVLGVAAAPHLPLGTEPFRLAFAGSIAAAMSDTLSSEIGGLYDGPRLVTTLEPVPPGTDGGVTWQGELAGIAGALLIAVVAVALFPLGSPARGAVAIVAGGVLGMTADSLFGATVEGEAGPVGNQTVNLLATLVGALASVGAAAVL